VKLDAQTERGATPADEGRSELREGEGDEMRNDHVCRQVRRSKARQKPADHGDGDANTKDDDYDAGLVVSVSQSQIPAARRFEQLNADAQRQKYREHQLSPGDHDVSKIIARGLKAPVAPNRGSAASTSTDRKEVLAERIRVCLGTQKSSRLFLHGFL
jgi:hypothetical protein